MNALAQLANQSLYQGYAYGYPHKTSYGALDPEPALREVWADETVSSLFLYAHVPFCEMRCGFCNLFTEQGAADSRTERYLNAFERQTEATRAALPPGARIAQMAIGGGTPTLLSPSQLERLFGIIHRHFDRSPNEVPTSIETSPATATPDRLAVLRRAGVQRVSMGVQSLLPSELAAMGRPERPGAALTALAALTKAGFPCVNIDLIYGAHNQAMAQSIASIDETLDQVLAFAPDEVFLYPLYVRPLTGLGRRARALDTPAWDEQRRRLYAHARRRLVEAGYRQWSMRKFCLEEAAAQHDVAYSCQTDGMVGLGAGARSYTTALHYSSEYAVGKQGVREIIDAYLDAPTPSLEHAKWGRWLTEDDRRRRYVIQGVLNASGLDIADYRARFGDDPSAHFELLPEACDLGWLAVRDGHLVPTARGYGYSDVLGPALYGEAVRESMQRWRVR